MHVIKVAVGVFARHVRRSSCTGSRLGTSAKCPKRSPEAWIPISRTRRQEVRLGDARWLSDAINDRETAIVRPYWPTVLNSLLFAFSFTKLTQYANCTRRDAADTDRNEYSSAAVDADVTGGGRGPPGLLQLCRPDSDAQGSDYGPPRTCQGKIL